MSQSHPWITVAHQPEHTCLTIYKDALCERDSLGDETPHFVTLVGRRHKSATLRDANVEADDHILRDCHGQVYLWPGPRYARRAVTHYIDCEALHPRRSLADSGRGVGPSDSFDIHWTGGRQRPCHQTFGRNLVTDVLAPLSNVVCYFAADLGGLQGVARILAEQVLYTRGDDLPMRAKPAVLVVLRTSSARFEAMAAEAKLLKFLHGHVRDVARDDASQERLHNLISSIRLLCLRTDLTPVQRGETFERAIAAASSARSATKAAFGLSFSFPHAAALFGSLLRHFCHHDAPPFSFIESSRPRGFSAAELPEHLARLLRGAQSDAEIWHSVVPHVASALLLASYPPGSHRFPTSMLFRHLFLPICSYAIESHSHHRDVQEKFVADIEKEFGRQAQDVWAGSSTAAQYHSMQVRAIDRQIPVLKSRETCNCLMRAPERELRCGHALCNTCLQLHATRSPRQRHVWRLVICPVCGADQAPTEFRLMPPTAGVRVLALDGGGVRGLIPILALCELEKWLEPARCRLADCFDLTVGSSAGGITALGLGVKAWTAADCLSRFEGLALTLFPRHSASGSSLTLLREFAQSCLNDCQYSPQAVDQAFNDTFGREVSLFSNLSCYNKVAVTVTTAKDALPCLITNYNGARRSEDAGYHIVRAAEPAHDVHVADAAICTSAAPWFFRPKAVPKLDTFEDGGLQENNPIFVAMSEARSVWPTHGDHPDFVLSLGTGYTSNPWKGVIQRTFSPVKARFPTRLFQNFMQCLDGEKVWRRFIGVIPAYAQHRYHRLNLPFATPEPRLDDSAAIASLKKQAGQWLETAGEQLAPIKDALLASQFYFELDDLPQFGDDGRYHATGQIFQREHLDASGCKAFSSWLQRNNAYFLVNGQPIPCVERALSQRLPFRRRISLSADRLDDLVTISIRGITSQSRSISGMPRSMADLIACQPLCVPFGTSEHLEDKPLPTVPMKRKLHMV